MHDEPFLCHFIDKIEKVSGKDQHTIARKTLLKRLQFICNKLGTKSPILIFGRKYDAEADLVCIRLLTKSINCVRLNVEDIPMQVLMTLLIGSKLTTWLTLDGRRIDTSEIKLAWLRLFDLTELDFGREEPARTFSFQQWHDALQALQKNMKCKWINNPQVMIEASDKSRQLMAAKEAGFNIPRTLITNDPEDATRFYNLHHGRIVLKALHHHGVEIDRKIYSMHSHIATKQDIKKFTALKKAPCILQERISRKCELRVTIVGTKMFAARIDFPSYRENNDIHRYHSKALTYTTVKLSDTFVRRCKKMTKLLDLQYAALDFIVDKRNRPVFLEVNPSGDWLWIEEKTGLPITKAMTDLVLQNIR